MIETITPPRPASRPWLHKTVAAAVSFGILAAIYWRIDIAALWESLARASLFWVVVAILALVPALALTGWRLQIIARPHAYLPFGEATKLVLIAHSLNMILPSRLGDLIKAHAMTVPGNVPGREALSVVIIEKTWDILAVMFWCAIGLTTVERTGIDMHGASIVVAAVAGLGFLVVASRAFARVLFSALAFAVPARYRAALGAMETVWTDAIGAFWRDRPRAIQVIVVTMVIWFIHLVEIWLFVLALGVHVPFLAHLGLAPLFMMASLLPFTLSGIGTRDAAIIVLYGPFMGTAAAAALGLLVILRYLAPAVAGIPFTTRYLARLRFGQGRGRTSAS